MSSRSEIRDKEDRLLLEMTELSADLARDMAARVRKAEVREDAERYSRACDRMIRSMRLCIALRRRLERLDARDETQRRVEAVDLRKARLRASLRSDIREACANPNRRFELDRELDETLAQEALYDRFVELPLNQVISRLRERLGLQAPPPPGGGGGPSAEEPMVEGAHHARPAPAAPSVTPSAGRATSPVVSATGEEKEAPS